MNTRQFIATALSLSSLATTAQANPIPHGPIEVVARFDSSKLETPESIAIDLLGNRYVSLALTGEIRKIAPDGKQSTFATLPLGAPPLTACDGYVNLMGALAIDLLGTLYVTVNSCDPTQRGVWQVTHSGRASLLSQLPDDAVADGLALQGEYLYVADTGRDVIWRIRRCDGRAEVWKDDPLLKKNPDAPAIYPGPNGIQFYKGEAWVSVSGGFRMVVIPVERDGSAGHVRVQSTGTGCDDFAFDTQGNLYCGTDPFETVVRIAPNGVQTVLFTAADGIDGPSATLFGRAIDGQAHELYITNGSFPFFTPWLQEPSLMKVKLEVEGLPR